MDLSAARILPADAERATLIGRAWVPGRMGGPSPVVIAGGRVYDLARVAPTVSELLNSRDPVKMARESVKSGWARALGEVADLISNSHADRRDPRKAYLLAPCDLQALRACGVTFIASMLERVIEEQAKGDPLKSDEIRRSIGAEIGTELKSVKPGSAEAMRLKESLVRRNLWSQYLEVGIGPDAEVFNKSQPLSAVGVGAEIGIRADSSWNNPEPEVVLAINRAGTVVGAALGNDVNLRDFEGRSALLLGKAKDNNASCAIGPFIRLFDGGYGIDDLRKTRIHVEVLGPEGYQLSGESHLANISRDPLDLASQAVNRTHQYPDGVMLFLGTQFAPTKDRGEKGKGFTHKLADIVSIRADALGMLVNRVNHSDKVAPWTFGINDLMRNLAGRGLL
ncbi:MAG TPA: fumarylacetoacetate hydrolase family protein [Burkholderiales bacterium]|jgi:fumarylacetoacetate (FAA) hydrolase family protein|nr:fumarylacetoacetate hydrolase family protein [Burkholderiales bacterium]